MVDVALATLIERLSLLHTQAQQAAVAQASYQLTRRNWLIGRHLTEGEQPSADHAVADSLLVTELAHHLRAVPGLSAPQLARCQDFYRTYPWLFPTGMGAAAMVDLPASAPGPADFWAGIPAEQLCRLSFAHFCELLSVTNARQRTFYEGQASRHNWSVRVLKQAIDSLLYEHTILSRDQDAVLAEYADAATPAPGPAYDCRFAAFSRPLSWCPHKCLRHDHPSPAESFSAGPGPWLLPSPNGSRSIRSPFWSTSFSITACSNATS